MSDKRATKEELNLIIERLEEAIDVTYTAPENPDEEGYPYATGYARSAMKQAVEDLQRLM
tara:strand:+ start:190 stop:369 length:180 start_codon:yes stop_codon:yes gene_type:complete